VEIPHFGWRRRHLVAFPLVAMPLVLAASCATDPKIEVKDDGPQGSFLSPSQPSLTGGGSSNGQGVVVLDDGTSCAVEVSAAEQRPLAMYIMLDSSGSMAEATDSGASKWQAVQGAIKNFVADPINADISLGMQFFPLLKPGSQFVCKTHEDCGPEGGPCFLNTCSQGTTINVCVDDSDCLGQGRCVPFGLCANSPDPDAPLACIMGRPCDGDLGDCVDFERTCTNATFCTSETYQKPAVEIGRLGAQRDTVVKALDTRVLEGLTPTGPALRGAVDQAAAYAEAHPEQSVVAVLATDGLPTECDPTEIRAVSSIAAVARRGPPPVRTFVIGVFLPGDTESKDNLRRIALAGGSNDAFFVDTSGDVSEQFLRALREVRNATLACEFNVPQTGTALDFFRVNLEFNDGNDRQQLFYVNDEDSCDTIANGWHYDVDPSVGTPTSIQVCPGVCQRFQQTQQGDVRVQVGCATIIR
jgi:von Willebrand factor type A domain-containing protein